MPMTVKKQRDMRHIPEEELHAYLDQALSRSQCVEIESHLAVCQACRRERDDIAALRDRTTALLATLGPPRRIKPPFAEIKAQAAARVAERKRTIRIVAWAASVSLAIGLGWIANSSIAAISRSPIAALPDPTPPASQAATPIREDSVSQPVIAAAPRDAQAPTPAPATPSRRTPEVAPVTPSSADATTGQLSSVAQDIPTEPLRVEITPVQQPAGELPTSGLWRSVSWDGAQAETNGWIPRVEGLPVVTVQMQPDDGESGQPLTVVAQRLASGEMIRTVEGPIAKVSDLLSHQSGPTVTASVETGDPAGNRRDERMLAIYGSVPIDSLRALLLKVR